MPQYRRQWAVIVGINYAHLGGAARAEVPQLKTAERDAQAVHDALIEYYGYQPDHVRLLLGEDAGRDQIRDAFGDNFLADSGRVTDDDSVLVYFAGHGNRRSRVGQQQQYVGLLYPADVRVIQDKGIDSVSCIRTDDVMRLLEDYCAARHKLVVLDSCHSGEVFNFRSTRSAGVNRGFRASLFQQPAFQAIAASRASQLAADTIVYAEHSPFTLALLDALKSGMGKSNRSFFTASELFAYIPAKFTDWELVEQNPQGGWVAGEGDFYFFPTDLEPEDFPDDQLALLHNSSTGDDPPRAAADDGGGGYISPPLGILLLVTAAAVTVGYYRRRRTGIAQLVSADTTGSVASCGAGSASPSLPMLQSERAPAAVSLPASVLSDDEALGWRLPVAVGAGMLLVSLTSLSLAYHGPGTTEAWAARFNQLGSPGRTTIPGFIIEAARSLVFVSLTIVLVWGKFKQETCALLSWRNRGLPVNIARALFLLITLVFGYHEASRHLMVSEAPLALAEWAMQHSIETTARAECWPYAAYLPYSLVHYMLLLPVLVTVPVMAIFSDMPALLARYRLLRSRAAHQKVRDSEVLSQFSIFENECHVTNLRYLDALAILALAVHFEYWIGHMTLTDQAINVMQMAWYLGGSAFVCIVIIAYLYSSGCEVAKTSLARLGSAQLPVFVREHNVITFLKTVLVLGVSGLVILSLVLPWLDNWLRAALAG